MLKFIKIFVLAAYSSIEENQNMLEEVLHLVKKSSSVNEQKQGDQ